MIEMDIHETRDERFVVHHDPSLDNGTPTWEKLTLPEIKNLTLNDARAPLLEECIAALSPTPINIEIKHIKALRISLKF